MAGRSSGFSFAICFQWSGLWANGVTGHGQAWKSRRAPIISRSSKGMMGTSAQLTTTSLLGETGPLSQGVQAGRKALRIRHIDCMEVRKKRPRGFK